jgi:predicted permease
MKGLGSDLRIAARRLRRSPGFTVAAALTLAIGIGATSSIFGIVRAVLLRPLPVHEPDRLVAIQQVNETGRAASSVSLPDYLDYRDQAKGAVAVAAHHISDATLSTGSEARIGLATDVSANYFDVLGVAPAAGRFFTDAEASEREAAPLVVLSHALWTQAYAGDPAVPGRTIRVNGQPFTILGVAPAGFTGAMIGAQPDVFLPIGLHGRLQPGRNVLRRDGTSMRTWLQMFGRLDAGVSAAQAEARLDAVAKHLRAEQRYPEGWTPAGARVRAFSAVPPQMRSGVAGFLSLLFGAAALLLVIASVNVAGMLLARGAAHRREIAIRVALGAGRAHLVRQVLAESLLVAVSGAAAGVLLAAWLTGLFVGLRPPFAQGFRLDVPLDAGMLAFAVLAALVSGLLLGLIPALQLSRATPMMALREASPTAPGDRGRLRSALVTSQVALSLVLLLAAGLFVRTLQRVLATPQPMRTEGVLALSLNLRLNGYDASRGHAFYGQLLERIRALPGTESAALASIIPLEPSWDQTQIVVPGVEAAPGAPSFAVGRAAVSPGYFETVKMPLLAGRSFTEDDARARTRAIVVNQTFARRFWPDRAAVGERVLRDGTELEIVGVVPDAKYRATDEEPTLYAYFPFAPEEYESAMWVHVRPHGAPGPLLAATRAQVMALDPDVPPVMVTTMDDVMGTALFAPRLAAALVGGFGLAGLVLSAVGLFGLLSYLVAQRTREIGVRIALGARPAQVVRLVLGQALRPLALGVALGLAGALAAARSLSALLHGLSPTDPVTFTLVPLALVAVALAAGVIPARRATRVDPVTALRSE